MDYIQLQYKWDQAGPLAQITTVYTGCSMFCSVGTINVLINGVSFGLGANEFLDDNFADAKTFEVEGTGTWKGYLRGRL